MSLTNYFKKLSFKDPPAPTKPEAKDSEPHEEEKRDPPYHTCKKPFTWTCDGYPPTPFISDHHWFHEQYFKKEGEEEKGVDPEPGIITLDWNRPWMSQIDSQMDFRSTSDLPESLKMKPPDKPSAVVTSAAP